MYFDGTNHCDSEWWTVPANQIFEIITPIETAFKLLHLIWCLYACTYCTVIAQWPDYVSSYRRAVSTLQLQLLVCNIEEWTLGWCLVLTRDRTKIQTVGPFGWWSSYHRAVCMCFHYSTHQWFMSSARTCSVNAIHPHTRHVLTIVNGFHMQYILGSLPLW